MHVAKNKFNSFLCVSSGLIFSSKKRLTCRRNVGALSTCRSRHVERTFDIEVTFDMMSNLCRWRHVSVRLVDSVDGASGDLSS